jgi:hypothetical protein
MYLSRGMLRILFTMSILLGLLFVFSILFIEPGSAEYFVAMFSLIPILLTFFGALILIVRGWEMPGKP